MERQEVRALLALDVDHLDVLTGLDLVAEGGRGVDAEVEPRLGERRRQLDLLPAARDRPSHLDEQLRRRQLAVDDPAAGCRDAQPRVPVGGEVDVVPGRRALPE